MESINKLRNKLSISRRTKITKIPRSYICYKRKDTVKQGESRIFDNTVNSIFETSKDRVTYGHRRIWAVLRSEGTKINIKTVRRLIEIFSGLLNFNVLSNQRIKLLKCVYLNLEQRVDKLETYNMFKFPRFGYISKWRHNLSNSFFLPMKSLKEELLL